MTAGVHLPCNLHAKALELHAVYGVWPASLLFLVAYTLGTQRFSRGALFNICISAFLLFFVGFGLGLPPARAPAPPRLCRAQHALGAPRRALPAACC